MIVFENFSCTLFRGGTETTIAVSGAPPRSAGDNPDLPVFITPLPRA